MAFLTTKTMRRSAELACGFAPARQRYLLSRPLSPTPRARTLPPTSWLTPAHPSAQACPPEFVAGPAWSPWSAPSTSNCLPQRGPRPIGPGGGTTPGALLQVAEMLVGAVLAERHDEWAEACKAARRSSHKMCYELIIARRKGVRKRPFRARFPASLRWLPCCLSRAGRCGTLHRCPRESRRPAPTCRPPMHW